MKRIKTRQRADTLTDEPRKGRGSLGRRIYYAILVIFVLAFGNYLFGDRFLLRSEGVVKHASISLEAPATVHVAEMFVRPGEAVRKGDPLFRVEALDARIQLSLLAERLASLKDIRSTRGLDRDRALEQLPLVRQQIEALERQMQTATNLQSRGLITQTEIDDIALQILNLKREQADLTGKSRVTFASDKEAELLHKNLARLNAIVSDSVVRAPLDGKVGQDLITLGAVATTGERLSTLLHGEDYVVAYLPDRYFFKVEPGLRVDVAGQQGRTGGVIQEILPFSEAVPIEFHNSLRPRGRSLLARILLDDTADFVMDQRVDITRSASLGEVLAAEAKGLAATSHNGKENADGQYVNKE